MVTVLRVIAVQTVSVAAALLVWKIIVPAQTNINTAMGSVLCAAQILTALAVIGVQITHACQEILHLLQVQHHLHQVVEILIVYRLEN